MTASREEATEPRSLIPLSGRRIARVAAVVLVTVLAVGSGLWWWVATTGLDPKDRATAQLSAVQISLSIGVASGGLFALYLAYRRQAHQELVARTTEYDAAERRVTELYTKAVDQLGSDQAPVRLGGLYALERLAQANPSQQQTIVNVLCAYLRMPYTLPGEKPGTDAPDGEHALYNERTQQREVRLAAERILASHLSAGLHVATTPDTFWPGIDLDLTGALLIDWRPNGCRVRNATFSGAQFTGDAFFSHAKFTGVASFSGAQFTGDAFFSDAKFTGEPSFSGAQFTGDTSFSHAKFTRGASFNSAHFTRGASFTSAQFTDVASFIGAQFTGVASFFGTQFTHHASFDRTQFIGMAMFDHAQFNHNALFNSTQFSSLASFSSARFAYHTSFDSAQFTHDASFNNARFTGYTSFNNAQFEQGAPDDLRAHLGTETDSETGEQQP